MESFRCESRKDHHYPEYRQLFSPAMVVLADKKYCQGDNDKYFKGQD